VNPPPCPWDTHYQFSIKTLLSNKARVTLKICDQTPSRYQFHCPQPYSHSPPPSPFRCSISQQCFDLLNDDQVSVDFDHRMMMMIAFITIKSSLVPLIEGLCAQIYFRFEISVVYHNRLSCVNPSDADSNLLPESANESSCSDSVISSCFVHSVSADPKRIPFNSKRDLPIPTANQINGMIVVVGHKSSTSIPKRHLPKESKECAKNNTPVETRLMKETDRKGAKRSTLHRKQEEEGHCSELEINSP